MPQITQNQRARSERSHIGATVRRKANLTEFIADSTCTQAEIDLADQNHFVLPPKAWNAFIKALEAPARVPPGLKRLFARGSVADRR